MPAVDRLLPVTILSVQRAGSQGPLRLGVLPTQGGYDDIGNILEDLGSGYDFEVLDWEAVTRGTPDIGARDVLFMTCPGLPDVVSLEDGSKARQAVTDSPEDASVLAHLAEKLATYPGDGVRGGRRAEELAPAACERTDWNDPEKINTLAESFAETGNFTEALRFPDIAEKSWVSTEKHEGI